MTRALSTNAKSRWILVEFRYGDPTAPTYTRLTSFSQNVTYEGDVYTSMAELAVALAANTGGLEDRATTITLKLVADSFQDKASNGERHSPISVTVREQSLDPNGVGAFDDLVLYKGKLKAARRTRDAVTFECHSVKGRLKVATGVPCNNQCGWTLGDHHCKVNLAALDETATVASVSGRTVTLTAVSELDATYWSRGYLERDGLRIEIRSWRATSPLEFELSDPPPAEWIGELVTVVPGCDKTIETCRARFDNESNFGGMGYPMPSWHPALEGP